MSSGGWFAAEAEAAGWLVAAMAAALLALCAGSTLFLHSAVETKSAQSGSREESVEGGGLDGPQKVISFFGRGAFLISCFFKKGGEKHLKGGRPIDRAVGGGLVWPVLSD